MRKALAVSIIIISILLASNLYLLTSREEHTFTMNTIVKVYINDQLVYVKKGDIFNKNMQYWIQYLFEAPRQSLFFDTNGNSDTAVNILGGLDNATETRAIYAITDSTWDPTIDTVSLPSGSILLDSESLYQTTSSGNTITIQIVKYRLFEDGVTVYGSALATHFNYKDPDLNAKWMWMLLCVDKFDTSVTVNAGDVLKIEYDIVINP